MNTVTITNNTECLTSVLGNTLFISNVHESGHQICVSSDQSSFEFFLAYDTVKGISLKEFEDYPNCDISVDYAYDD